MHRALRLPEIARITASYVSPYGDDWFLLAENYLTWRGDPRLSTQDLLNMALTCRDLCGLALDGLWECMDDLTPLFCLFSNYGPSDYSKKNYTIRGLIEDHERTRFDIYANRIRCYKHRKYSDIPVSACAHILREYQRSCVLPRLHFLYIADDTPSIHFFFSPHLRELHTRPALIFNPIYGNIVDLIYSISPTSSSLNSLNIAVGLEPKLLGAILRLPRLRILYLENTAKKVLAVDFEPLCQIASSQTLLELKISGRITWVANNTDSSMDGRRIFPSLSYLSLSCRPGDFKVISSYLDRISLPKLETFELSCTSPLGGDAPINLPVGQWDRFCDALGRLLGSTSTFRRLTIHLPPTNDTITILPPLLDVLPTHTTSFSLFSFCIDTCRRDDVFGIAQALPRLENLDVPRFPEPYLSFPDLLCVVRALPRLRHLTAQLDLRTVRVGDDGRVLVDHPLEDHPLKDHPLKDHPLKVITTTTLQFDSAHAHTAARALVGVFPRLRDVMFPQQDEEAEQSRLDGLRRLVRFAGAVRLDDAKRVGADM